MSTVVSVHRRGPKEQNGVDESLLQQYLLRHNRALRFGENIKNSPDLQKVIDATKILSSFTISAPSVGYLELVIGGIVDDRYFFEPLTLPNGLVKRRINEVNIFAHEELDRLNLLLGANCLPGSVGENILTKGINIDALPIGTLLGVGDAVLRVSGRRTFCWKFAMAFIKKDFYEPADFQKFNKNAVGMATQVVTPGVVKARDAIHIIKIGNGPVYKPRDQNEFELFRPDSNLEPIALFVPNQTNT